MEGKAWSPARDGGSFLFPQSKLISPVLRLNVYRSDNGSVAFCSCQCSCANILVLPRKNTDDTFFFPQAGDGPGDEGTFVFFPVPDVEVAWIRRCWKEIIWICPEAIERGANCNKKYKAKCKYNSINIMHSKQRRHDLQCVHLWGWGGVVMEDVVVGEQEQKGGLAGWQVAATGKPTLASH